MRKIVEAMVGQGFQKPGTGLFLLCPICASEIGQQCISVPLYPLHGAIHPERVEMCRETLMAAG
ncbi:hypothetical protein [Micromonospora sp. NPDC051141]|uniref:hypothetical protein n=1 Tax=Micromonospora sp. NPDC051141 TaxID=3364284 RepID=UPI0037A9CB26